jgi:hypothetical protein
MALVVEYRDAVYSTYLDSRSRDGFLGDYGLLTDLAVFEDGQGWAVGRDGPPMRRSPRSGRWYPDPAVPLGRQLITLDAAGPADVWFGSYKRGMGVPSVAVHFDGSEFHVYELPTLLPIWAVEIQSPGRVWALASSWQDPGAPRQTDVIAWDGSSWTMVAHIDGEMLATMDARDEDVVLAAGSGAFECSPSGCVRVTGLGESFIRDVAFSSSDHGYAAGTAGVYEYSGGAWSRDTSFDAVRSDDLVDAIGGTESCAMATGRDFAWVRKNGEWTRFVIGVATALGPFRFVDIDPSFARGDLPRFWSSGAYNTVIRADPCSGDDLGTSPSAPTVASGTATPTSDRNPEPARGRVFLPISVQDFISDGRQRR